MITKIMTCILRLYDKYGLVAGDHHNGQRGRGHGGQPGERRAGQQEGSAFLISSWCTDIDHQDDRPWAEAKESEWEQPDPEDAGGHGQLHIQRYQQPNQILHIFQLIFFRPIPWCPCLTRWAWTQQSWGGRRRSTTIVTQKTLPRFDCLFVENCWLKKML